jgi:two-component system, response regulator PdtaR
MTSSRPAALIVEDQPFVGLVASDILRESGFRTFHAYDANDAAEVLEQHPEIQVLVTDAQLPGETTGIELARQVSRLRPDVQLVVTSAGHDLRPNDVPQGARVLHKPYASGELRTLIAAKDLLEEV